MTEVSPQFVSFRPHKPSQARKEEERKHGRLLRKLTVGLVDTYQRCSHGFEYSLQNAPRRVLTKLSKGIHNGGYDNEQHDYICRVGDKIINPDGGTYEILERLGHGTFGQVLKCNTTHAGSQTIALKIIKNKPAYFHQALVEVRILQMLNKEFDPDDDRCLVRMTDFFVYRTHLCIAFELLSVNLYDVLKQNSFRGVSMALIRVLTEQLLMAMRCLRKASVIHCDLKPENVLLSNMQRTRIKLIDFGSACFENHTVYSYIQSRFYRSPEVLLGLPYTSAIDMWSLGCICAELFLGLPIFPGHSEYDQMCRVVEVLGMPSQEMLLLGKHSRRYFHSRVDESALEVVGQGSGDGATGSGGDGEATLPIAPSGSSADRRSDIDGEQLGAYNPQEAEDHPVAGGAERTAASGALLEDSPPVITGGSDSSGGLAPENLRRSDSLLGLVKGFLGMQTQSSTDDAAAPQIIVRAPPEDGAASGGKGIGEGRPSSGSTTTTDLPSSDVPPNGSAASHNAQQSDTVPNSSDGSVVQKFGADGEEITGAVLGVAPGQKLRHVRMRRKRSYIRLKTREEYERDEHKKEPIPKKYFSFKSLEQMIELVPPKTTNLPRGMKDEGERRLCFLQFLQGVLELNPDKRLTPKQASEHPFITGHQFDPKWQPQDDEPVTSFTKAPVQRPMTPGDVPRLQPFSEAFLGGASLGGGSARTWLENAGGSGKEAAEQPQSAPATTRGSRSSKVATGASIAPSTNLSTGSSAGSGDPAKQESDSTRDVAKKLAQAGARGLFSQLKLAPEHNSAESYRPPIDQLSEEFFKGGGVPGHAGAMNISNNVVGPQGQRSLTGEHVGLAASNHQKLGNNAWSVSTGASLCSSASSTASTPNGGRGGRSFASPHSVGSPLTVGGAPMKGQLSATQLVVRDPGSTSATGGRPQQLEQLSGTTARQAPSPHGSSSANQLAGNGPGGGGNSAQLSHRSAGVGSVGAGSGASVHSRGAGSRDQSRGSSPWHLPSPMSELSAVSDRINSSQPSGSDSCGANRAWLTECDYEGAQCNFDECAYEDPSQSDTPHWPRSAQLSDSDCTTPRSDAAPVRAEGDSASGKEQHGDPWENIKSEITRVELSRDRLPRRLDITQSPGGNWTAFREAVGMTESGPVIPFGAAGAVRRDVIDQIREGEAAVSTVAPGAPGGVGPFSPLPRASSGHQLGPQRKPRRQLNGTV